MSLESVNIPIQETMVSEDLFLKSELDAGIHHNNGAFVHLCHATANAVKGLGIETVMDYGCGTGVYSYAFMNEGFNVVAWEKFKAHKDYISEKLPQIKIIDEPITTDLMLFIEVAEHMTDKELDKLFKSISPKYILFSSTSERTAWDLAWGHINIKEQTEWLELFEKKGYRLVRDTNVPTSWSKLFQYECINK
jgi:2-polyprenyl-3-methyl-5-hydroxy-6-metoxy-1,4-benzoquinol methylase